MLFHILRVLVAGSAVLAVGPGVIGLAQTSNFDIVLANGRVIDPESGLDAVRHVGITGGTIREVSSMPLKGRSTIDATGLVVSPGFIDLHQHGHTPEAYRSKAADGVTSALELEVGVGDIDQWYGERAGKTPINYGASIGHIPVRIAALNDPGAFLPSGPAAQREASDAELEQIRGNIARGLSRGAVGVGFGIAYTPGAARTEILDAFVEAGRAGAPAYVHMRGGDPIASLQEVIALSVVTDTPLHVVHVQSSGGRQTPAVLRIIELAQKRGIDVTTEMYPYTASQTRIESALYDNWQTFSDERFQQLLWPATGERLTRETFAKYRAIGGSVISFSNTEEVVSHAAGHPLTMIASDGSLTHPRGSGSFSRILGRYVREMKVLALTDALKKMTIMPAKRLESRITSMQRKGRIKAGADADITMFDPAKVIDEATYQEPTRPSAGIRHVLVGGTFVLKDGVLQEGVTPGKPLRAPVR